MASKRLTNRSSASPLRYKASLLVGATDMLGGAARWIAERSDASFLVARHASTAPVVADLPHVTALDLDWSDDTRCLATLEQSGALSATDLAILWIHGSGARTETRLIERLSMRPCLIVKVRGSADLGDLRGKSRNTGYTDLGSARLITVTLGARLVAGGGKRWLTWQEISDGVIAAIEARENHVVGSLDY